MENETKKLEKKILVVEDTAEELEYAKKIIESAVADKGNVLYAGNLTEAIRLLNTEQGIDTVITDVFYPIGQNMQNKEEFFKILGEGLYQMNVRGFNKMCGLYGLIKPRKEPKIIVEIEKYSLKEIRHSFSESHINGAKIGQYLLDELAQGKVEDNDVPSGILLGLYSFQNGKSPIFISSNQHHGAKTDSLTWLVRSGIFGDECAKNNRCIFLEDINRETGKKYWEEAVGKISTIRETEFNYGKEMREKIMNKEYGEEVKNLIQLSQNLERYLKF